MPNSHATGGFGSGEKQDPSGHRPTFVDTFKSRILEGVENPEEVAKILARSFYKELRRAGFQDKHIVMIASELIDSLSETLRRTREKITETPLKDDG